MKWIMDKRYLSYLSVMGRNLLFNNSSNTFQIWKEYESGDVCYNRVNTFILNAVHLLNGYIFYYQSNMVNTSSGANVIKSLINLMCNTIKIFICSRCNMYLKIYVRKKNCFIKRLNCDCIVVMKGNIHRYWY